MVRGVAVCAKHNIVDAKHHIVYTVGVTLFAEGNLVLCPLKRNDVFAKQKMMLTARGQTMLYPYGHKHKKYDYYPFIQYFDVQKTLRTKQGLCFDFAHLFAAFCRSQNIPCYAVDGISRKNNADRHTWNRVYYNGAWWNVDITTDNSRTANGKELYGFHKLEGAFVPDEDFFITKIY